MKKSIPPAFAILALCSILSGCDDAEVAGVGPSHAAFRSELDTVSLVPDSFGRDGLLGRCPSVSPFAVPFNVSVAAGALPLTLFQVRVEPTNPFGRTSPPTIFDSSSLTRRFGSVGVASFEVRQFAFTHDVLCDMRGGRLAVSVTTMDGRGMPRMSMLQVPVY